MGHVLYLDDEQALVFLVSSAVTRLGHRVSGFTSAPEALEAFREHPQDFDLVLTDMSMYGMSGLEFAQEVLHIEPRAAVVIATGCEDPNWADYARASGVREVIEKPTTIDAMAKAISGLLSRREI
jgi:two-component system, cell cycle sensor histidine kinase and response regulator CckA